MQILEGEAFQEEIDRTIKDTTKIPVPRGLFYDRYGNVIVENKPLYSITYTPAKGVQAEEKLEVAEKLATYISMDSKKEIDSLTERNKQEYWYLKNKDAADERLSEEEAAKMDNAKQYDTILKRITEEEISDFTKEELEVMVVKKEMDKAYSLTPQIIKNEDVTPEEYARVAENLDNLPGVNATTDWERDYPFKDSLKSLLGSITSQEQGLPAEEIDYYLTRGYNRNDRVGKSGLEEQYEDVLRGRKEQIEYTTTKTGTVLGTDIAVEGERGKDLVLTFDMDYQKKVDELLLKELKSARSNGNNYLEDVLAVVLNPKTGEILAMSGQHYNSDKGEYESTPHKVMYDAHRPGSTIKGATVLAGLESGVFSPGETIYDSPIKIKGSAVKRSYTSSLGAVNDISALKMSSNIYMFYAALRMGGEFRYPFPDNAGTSANTDEGLLTMRNYFNQFGLGVKTGVDFPFESTGYVGPDPNAGNLMDFAIGQYDTYTTLQLAQYVATIANDGYRVQPHLVKEVRFPAPNNEELGPVYQVNETNVLSKINVDDSYIERTKEGFYQVVNEPRGTGYNYWAGKSYQPAGKTGTAENEIYEQRDDGTFYKKADTNNLSLVGFAPYDDPEVAFAVIVPNLNSTRGDSINHKIGTGLMDLYFDMKEEQEDESEEE